MAKKNDTADLMTWAEACLELKCSRSTIKRMIAKELISAPKQIRGFRQAYFDRAQFLKESRLALGWSTAKDQCSELDVITVADACEDVHVQRTTVMRMVAKEILSPSNRLGNFRQAYFERRVFSEERRRALV